MNLNKIQNKKIISLKKPPSQKVLNPEFEQFQKQTTVRGYYQPSGSHKKSLIKDICEEMLINGNIDSYVNFFYLTHKTENPNESKDKKISPYKTEENDDSETEERKYFEVETCTENRLKESKIDKNKDNLLNTDNLFNFNTLFVNIEECERNGNLLEGYSAKKNLAEYFGRLNNWDEAINYYQKAYDSIMLLKNKVELRLEAIYNIGRAYEKNNQIVKALAYYTKCREVTLKENHKDYELMSSKKIVKLRLIIANKLDKKKKYEKEIEHYKKCINIIKESYNDKDEINTISFRLGTAYYKNNNLDKAITLFDQFINNSDDSSKNMANKRLAHASIADCYVSKDDLDKAIEHLEKFISFNTKDIKQKNAQINALNKLGIIYNKRGEYKKAVVCFEKHFQLLNTIKEEVENNTNNNTNKLERHNSKRPSIMGYPGTMQEQLMKENERIEEENHLKFKKELDRSMNPLFSSDSQSSLSSEKDSIPIKGVIENSKKFNEALIQMGVAKADNELERFFTWIQKSDTSSLKSLLQWKANRSIVEFGDESDDILINSEKDTEDLLRNKNASSYKIMDSNIEADNENNESNNENNNETNSRNNIESTNENNNDNTNENSNENNENNKENNEIKNDNTENENESNNNSNESEKNDTNINNNNENTNNIVNEIINENENNNINEQIQKES
jgi:tetratricopeptide (TPR) repeat protein